MKFVIDVTYTGAAGSILEIEVTDDTIVKTVEVTFTAAKRTIER